MNKLQLSTRQIQHQLVKVRWRAYVWLVLATLLCTSACTTEKRGTDQTDSLDTLLTKIDNHRLKWLDSTLVYAEKAKKHPLLTNHEKVRVTETLAFVYLMKMELEKAEKMYASIADLTKDEISRLKADVGMMAIKSNTAEYKLFYDYREKAMHRIKRIEQEKKQLEVEKTDLFYEAVAGFHLVCAEFYCRLEQREKAEKAIEQLKALTENIDLASDWNCIYLFANSKNKENHQSIPLKKMWELEKDAEQKGNSFMIASIMRQIANIKWETASTEDEKIAAQKAAVLALQAAKEYESPTLYIPAYLLVAKGLNQQTEYQAAIDTLERVIASLNELHTKKENNQIEKQGLKAYEPQTDSIWSQPSELKWLTDDKVKIIPEWILKTREQLSIAYAGLNMTAQSHYNRNIYLDLLTYTKQDQELETRYEKLTTEEKELDQIIGFILWAALIGIALLLVAHYIKKRKGKETDEESSILETLKQLMEDFDGEKDEGIEETLKKHLSKLVKTVIKELSWKYTPNEEDEKKQQIETNGQDKYHTRFGIKFPLSKKETATLELYTKKKLSRADKSLINLVIPYILWCIENSKYASELDEEYDNQEEQQAVTRRENAKLIRDNLTTRAALTVISTTGTLIERLKHETNVILRRNGNTITEGQCKYMHELTNKINEYNTWLEKHISLEQRHFSLKIETFPLAELFSMLAKGWTSMPGAGQNFITKQTEAWVKADKALTMFMLTTLTENARKFTPEGGEITVTAEEQEEYVEISVIDNGPGLTPSEINLILNGTYYDSTLIGKESTEYEQIKAKKGSGFGLMNCKGIIEKYKKAGGRFGICTFGIESVTKKGSRFYFRLPRVITTLTMLALMVCIPQSINGKNKEVYIDSLLETAARHADQAYYSNIDAEYDKTICHIDSAIACLNAHYLLCYPEDTTNIMTLKGNGVAAETYWFDRRFDSDYHIILDIRNEAAVAYLAKLEWQEYDYNNQAYTRLYKRLCEDPSIEEYCRQTGRSATNKTIAVVLLLAVIIGCGTAYYLIYLRPKATYRFHLGQLIEMSRNLLKKSLETDPEAEVSKKIQTILETIGRGINEIFTVDSLALVVTANDGKSHYACYPSKKQDEINYLHLKQAATSENKELHQQMKGELLIPLVVKQGKKEKQLGIIAFYNKQEEWKEESKLLAKLIAGFTATIVRQRILNPTERKEQIEDINDSIRCTQRENERLYIQNQVIAGCMSLIKHETIYYPSRISWLLKKYESEPQSDAAKDTATDLSELVTFYREVLSLLSSCAFNQLEKTTFRRSVFSVEDIMKHAKSFFSKTCSAEMRKRVMPISQSPTLECQTSDFRICGDYDAVCFLVENLITESIDISLQYTYTFTAKREGNLAIFCFTDPVHSYTQKELNLLFTPDWITAHPSTSHARQGMGWLICRTIIREHDTHMGHPGLRIYATPSHGGRGTNILFQLTIDNQS